MNLASVQVLLVEDDDVEIMAIRRALRSSNIPHELTVARDGVDALLVLEASDGDHRPDVVFLDINMPRMNGFEFLRRLRSHVEYERTEIVIVTTSFDAEDKRSALDHHVSGYVMKLADGDFERFAGEVGKFLAMASRH